MVKTAGKRVKIYQWTENGLDIQVTKKAIRNMYLRVGADGSIRVSAPLKMSECDIRRFIRERMDWIEEHRKKKGQNLPPWEIYEGREREAKKQECRMRLEKILPRVIQECEQKVGVHAEEWRLRDMKTRWGTCNVEKKRIWLNVCWRSIRKSVWNMWSLTNWCIFWSGGTTGFFMDIWMCSILGGKM